MMTTKEFLEDVRDNGLRFDLNPTYNPNEAHAFFHDYMRRMDRSIRERAKDALLLFGGEATDQPCCESKVIEQLHKSAEDYESSISNTIQNERNYINEAARCADSIRRMQKELTEFRAAIKKLGG